MATKENNVSEADLRNLHAWGRGWGLFHLWSALDSVAEYLFIAEGASEKAQVFKAFQGGVISSGISTQLYDARMMEWRRYLIQVPHNVRGPIDGYTS